MDLKWFDSIGRPRYVAAPMVDASELAWRILCRRHGAELCYTPMFHSNVFTRDAKYRKEIFTTCPSDRPLIVQFCGNNPDVMAAAAKLVESECDAIDVNLGCPQTIAKRGKYGAFLQDDWELLRRIVMAMSNAVKIPITCKVRIFESIERSIEYAQMLQAAGCKLLTVHGRTREQKGPLTGVASWKHIKAVRQAVSVPMLANGNIQCLEDVHRCIDYTKVNGVMSAEGILTNPALYEGINPVSWEIAEEYLSLVQMYPCPTSYIRGHLFKIFHKIFTFDENKDIRQLLATAQNINDFIEVCVQIKTKYVPYNEGLVHYPDDNGVIRIGYNLILPPWICQPYIRMTPEEHIKKMEICLQKQDNNNDNKITHVCVEGNVVSKKKMKKLLRESRRPNKEGNLQSVRSGEICVNDRCANPLGGKCEYKLCKKCCKNKCYEEDLDCKGHRILIHTRRLLVKRFAGVNGEDKLI